MEKIKPALPVSFVILWVGQVVSTTGSSMTQFGLALWAFEQTRQATTLALTGFFELLPSIFITLFAGVLVDRYKRKHLIMLSDSVAALLTLGLLGLATSGNLQIWHIYISAAIAGAFGQIQSLAYNVSVSLLLPKEHFTRANSMLVLLGYAPQIIALPVASVLYPVIGIGGLLVIDLLSFILGIVTVGLIKLPQPAAQQIQNVTKASKWQELSLGFRFIWQNPGLRAMLGVMLIFSFGHDLHAFVQTSMVLARSNQDGAVVAAISAAAGVAGVLSGIIMIIWGGPKKRVHGWLLGVLGAGISKLVISLGQTPLVWISAQFCSSLNFPLLVSSRRAIWQTKVNPAAQGRVFASLQLGLNLGALCGRLIAGPLADNVFEPALQPGGALAAELGWLVGTQHGSGMALVMVIGASLIIISGSLGYLITKVRTVENCIPDFDAVPGPVKKTA